MRGTAGGDPRVYREWDSALRRTFGGGLGGVPVTVSAAGYGAGWALADPTGRVQPDASGVAYANVVYLDDLSRHAELAAGRWATPGASPPQATLAEPAARLLGLGAGDPVPLADRRTGRITEVLITGVWRVRAAGDPYWRLAPDVRTGVAPQSATYGPLVVDRADFADRFAVSESVAWQNTPDLDQATLGQLERAAAAAAAAGA
ncbi:MAG TPA: ABC transporter permease, partial [Actinoplanes sp.]|nr:ABC transporter permease [Actinoplanes sp.]